MNWIGEKVKLKEKKSWVDENTQNHKHDNVEFEWENFKPSPQILDINSTTVLGNIIGSLAWYYSWWKKKV